MKFKSFINEAERVTIISDKDVQRLLKTEYSAAVKQWKSGPGHRIYRGRPGNENFFLGDSTVGERKSANTKNYYTLWIDNSAKWKKYPKRSKSFICSTNYNSARGYGAVCVVLPKNKTTIGVCPTADIWGSFIEEMKQLKLSMNSLDTFNYFLYHVFKYISEESNPEEAEQSYSNLIKNIRLVDKEIPSFVKEYVDNGVTNLTKDQKEFISRYTYNFVDLLKMHKKFGPNNVLEKTMDAIFDTSRFKIENSVMNLPERREVWFSGTALFIKESYAAKLLKDIRKGPYD